MFQVGRALALHEFVERARDRWVAVISALFALMAVGVSLYGRSAGESGAMLTGPSLVTLASLLVPLVALVLGHDAICGERERNTLGLLLSLPASAAEILVAKYLGRLLALVLSVGLGLSVAMLLTDDGGRRALLALVGPTLLLGASFLTLGVFLSVLAQGQATAISLVVAAWFLLVFFYDLGILAVQVISDGALSLATVKTLVLANPAGLYRVNMMASFAGESGFEGLGGVLVAPTAPWLWGQGLFWTLGLLLLSGWIFGRRKAYR